MSPDHSPSQPPPPPPGVPGYRQFGVGPATPAGGEGPGAWEGSSLGPLQRRLLGIAGLLAVLMIALIVFHALHTGSTGLNAVAEAAERTAAQPGGKLAMEVTYTVEGLPGQTAPRTTVANGGGAYNAKTGRAQATLMVPVPGGSPVSVVSVGDEKQVFLRSSSFSTELPAGKEWIGLEPFLGHDPQMALGSSGGGKGQLDVLKAVGGGVEKLDRQTVRGHLTTRYKGSVEFSKAAALFAEAGETELAQEYEHFAALMPAPIPVEAWIDENGLARQVRMVETLPTTTSDATVTMDMRIQYYDFGAHPKIAFPPRGRVFDTTPILRAELGLEDGSTLGRLTPPAGAKPLSPTAFRGQVLKVCRSVAAEAKTFLKEHSGAVEELKGMHDATSVAAKREALAVGGPLYEGISRVLGGATRRFARIAPPASMAGEYHQLLTINAKQSEWLLAAGRAFQAGPSGVLALKSREESVKSEEAESKSLEKRLGISRCGGVSSTSSVSATAA